MGESGDVLVEGVLVQISSRLCADVAARRALLVVVLLAVKILQRLHEAARRL